MFSFLLCVSQVNDLWAALVCYMCVLYLRMQPHVLMVLLTQFTVTRLHPVSGEACVTAARSVTLLGTWPSEYKVMAYFFRNVYGIAPPGLHTSGVGRLVWFSWTQPLYLV